MKRICFFFERAGDRTGVFFATFEHVCCASPGLVLLYSIVLVCNVALSVYAFESFPSQTFFVVDAHGNRALRHRCWFDTVDRQTCLPTALQVLEVW